MYLYYELGDILFNIDKHGEVIKSFIFKKSNSTYGIQDEFGCEVFLTAEEIYDNYFSNVFVREAIKHYDPSDRGIDRR